MQEDLRIIIKAETDKAKQSIKEVNKELDKIKDTGKESGKSLDLSMKTIAKGAAVAIGAVVALTTALATMGKKSIEVQKNFSKLNAAFESAGGSAAQAGDTYKNLYRFLGDSGKATEAAQQLAKITTEEKKLTEWTKILQGVYAEMGDTLPVESLAEAANETIKVNKVTGTMADALNWVGVSEDEFNKALEKTNSEAEREALVRSTLNSLYADSAYLYERNNQALLNYNESQYRVDSVIASLGAYLTPLLTELNNLAASLLTTLAPAIETVTAVLIVFARWIIIALEAVGAFFGVSSSLAQSTSSYSEGLKQYYQEMDKWYAKNNKGAKDQEKNLNKLKKQLMGFDELNVVSDPSKYEIEEEEKEEIPMPKLEDFVDTSSLFNLDEFEKKISEIEEKLKPILVLVGLIAAGIAAWKLTNFVLGISKAVKIMKEAGESGALLSKRLAGDKAAEYLEGVKAKALSISGIILAVAGAMMTVKNYTDAWANGINTSNIIGMLAGMAATITGLYFALGGGATGGLAASIGAVVAGLALMVLGVKDFINNGATLENTILIIGGAIAVAVGLATAGLSVLVAAIVAAVAAVAAFTAAILLEKPAIMDVEEAQEALNAAKERAAEAENNYINAVDSAEASLNRLKEAEAKAEITGAELYEQVQNGTLDYANMTDAQKEVYKAYLDNEKKQQELKTATEELNAAKKAETIASYENQLALAKETGNYEEFRDAVVAAFEEGELSAEEARELIGKSMSEMSDDSQQTFMKDLPSDIKTGLDPSKYETTGKKITDWFSKTGNKIGTFFSDSVWKPIKDWWNEKVKPIFTKDYWVKKFNKIKEGAKEAFNGVIDTVERAVNFIIRKINKLSWDIPDWVPVVGGKKFGFDFNEIKIPRLATGGIVTQSTLANIGEAGREAVLPLDNNTEWMDKLADRINGRSNQKIVLMLDGKELGYATIGSINNITKQTGTLPLVLV